MTSFKETRDFIPLSYKIGLIDDENLFTLYPSYISQNLDLPFRLDGLPLVILTKKQNKNTDKKLNLSTPTICLYNDYAISLKIRNF